MIVIVIYVVKLDSVIITIFDSIIFFVIESINGLML
jgi:hypothetical protein